MLENMWFKSFSILTHACVLYDAITLNCSLNGNIIGDIGAAAMASALRHNNSLKGLK